jgi:hypothetical protein
LKNSTPAPPFQGHSTVLQSTRFKSYRPKRDLNYGGSSGSSGGDGNDKNDNDDKDNVVESICERKNNSETNNLPSAILPSTSSSSSSSSSFSSYTPFSSSSSSSYTPSFSLPVTVPKKRRVVGVSDIHGKSITTSTPNNNNDQDNDHINNNNGYNNNNNDDDDNDNISNNSNNNDTVLPIRSYVYNGRGDNAEIKNTLNNIEVEKEVENEVEKEEVEEEECRLLDSDFHLIVMTHAEVSYNTSLFLSLHCTIFLSVNLLSTSSYFLCF